MDLSSVPSFPDAAVITCLASAVSELGHEALPAALIEVINAFCPFDSSLVMLYSAHRRPDILVDKLSHALRQNKAEHYVAGAYLLDPFYVVAKDAQEPALLRMRDIAPKDFDTSEYFVNYYKQSYVVDELNYIVPLSDDRVLAISFERSTSRQPFSDEEMAICASYLPLIASLVVKHVGMPDVTLPENVEDREHQRLEALLRSFGDGLLSAREREVAHLMLTGFSASSIAETLCISVETVKVHRRHIYEKFGISSLAELFALALKAIYARKTI